MKKPIIGITPDYSYEKTRFKISEDYTNALLKACLLYTSVYITFAGEEFAITSVQCYFSDEAQIEKVMELQEGDTITLVGVCDGKFGNVLIKDCVFE